MPELSKTDLIVQLLAANLPIPQIMVRASASQGLVYKVKRRKSAEIEALRAGCTTPPAPAIGPSCPVPVAVPAPAPSPEPCPASVPTLDATQPAAPQLEAMAWGVVAKAASGDSKVTTKQIQAAREIIKQALRDRVPAPTDRKMVFKLDQIEIGPNDKPTVVSQNTYQVNP